jgi:hypothetical protein
MRSSKVWYTNSVCHPFLDARRSTVLGHSPLIRTYLVITTTESGLYHFIILLRDSGFMRKTMMTWSVPRSVVVLTKSILRVTKVIQKWLILTRRFNQIWVRKDHDDTISNHLQKDWGNYSRFFWDGFWDRYHYAMHDSRSDSVEYSWSVKVVKTSWTSI